MKKELSQAVGKTTRQVRFKRAAGHFAKKRNQRRFKKRAWDGLRWWDAPIVPGLSFHNGD